MCGGSGLGVWPESRESLPKQFIPLIGDRSTFQSIVEVVGDRAMFERAVVITNFDYRFRVAEQLKEIGVEATILLEPERRDSAAAVGAAAASAAARDDAIVAVLAATCSRRQKGIRPALRSGRQRREGRRNRHLPRHAESSRDRLRLYPTGRAAGRRSEGPPGRAFRRETERGAGERPSSKRLSAELGQFRIQRGRDAGRATSVRAGDRGGRPSDAVALAKTDLGFVVLDQATRSPRRRRPRRP